MCCAAINTAAVTLSDVLPVVINDLFELEADSLLFLDDYHLIDNDDIHRAVAYLLDHMPSRLHLLLTTRSVPPLPLLSRLRVQGQMMRLTRRRCAFLMTKQRNF